MPIGIRAAKARPLGMRRFSRPEVKYHLEPDEWPELATYRNCLPQTELAYRLIVLVPYICRCAGTAIYNLDRPADHAAPIDMEALLDRVNIANRIIPKRGIDFCMSR
jgi:hypothetical protein